MVPGTSNSEPTIVLLTVNERETNAVLDAFVGQGKEPVCNRVEGVLYAMLGNHGGVRLILATSEPGAGRSGGSQQRATQAIRHWNPKALIAVGVGFGCKQDEHQMGDVLVSQQLADYELGRVEKDGTITPRGDIVPAPDRLISTLKTMNTMAKRTRCDWPIVRFGLVLSGDKLVDNLDYRNSLRDLYHDQALGGEMEGCGLYTAANDACLEHRIDWVVIKAISDWADGTKGEDKELDDQRQNQAAKNATIVLKEMLLKYNPYASGGTGHPISAGTQTDTRPSGAANNISSASTINAVISALEDCFDFRWEPGGVSTSDLERKPVWVYWPVRVRQKAPIHAVQAFAAAALSRRHALICLVLDDLGTTPVTAETLGRDLKTWFEKAGGDALRFSVTRLSAVFSPEFDSPDRSTPQGQLAWDIQQKWLANPTNPSHFREVLELMKVLRAKSAGEGSVTIDGASLQKRAGKLLTPPVLWACLNLLIRGQLPGVNHNQKPAANDIFITLGGYDERNLWKTWDQRIRKDEVVGHLYNPRLAIDGASVSMDDIENWRSRDDIEEHILQVIGKPASSEYLGWFVQECINLLRYCKGDTPFDWPQIGSDPEQLISELHRVLLQPA